MKYLTRVLLDIEADGPAEAAEQLGRLLETVPADGWVYRAEDTEGGFFYVYKGEVYTLPQLQERLLSPDEIERIRSAQSGAREG